MISLTSRFQFFAIKFVKSDQSDSLSADLRLLSRDAFSALDRLSSFVSWAISWSLSMSRGTEAGPEEKE